MYAHLSGMLEKREVKRCYQRHMSRYKLTPESICVVVADCTTPQGSSEVLLTPPSL